MPGVNAIAKDTVIAVGGLGTQADRAENNGGGATKTAWDSGVPADFIDTNGGPKSADTAISYDHAGGTPDRKFSKAGIGANVTVGTLAYVSGTNITTGIYEITSIAGDDSWVACADIIATGDNADSIMNIGGAIDSLQNALDGQDAATQNRFIYYNISSVTLTVPIDIDVYGGSAATRIIVKGYNADLTAITQVTITTNSDINTLLNFSLGTGLFICFYNFIFDAGGVNKANYCAYGVGPSDDWVTFINCLFDDAEDGAAVFINGDNWAVLNCELKESGGGFITGGTDGVDSRVIGCSIHDNTGDGIKILQERAVILNNIIYDNTGVGINLATVPISHVVMGNTLYANDGDNLSIVAGGYYCQILNNVSVGSTGGYGFNLNGNSPDAVGFGYNLSAGNSSGHTDVSGTFADLGIGSNIASAQAAADIFTDVTDGAEDFTPKAGSDLIDNALDAGTA